MKFINFLIVLFLLIFIGISTPTIAQVKGGRKKEHRNQRGGGFKLFGNKSRGNAQAFAKGHRSRGIIARVLYGKKSGSSWVYHKTNPGKKQNREQSKLFSRNRTKGKRFTDGIIASQNKRRTSHRVHGNQSFTHRKH